ncbi:MAG TPA: 8-amino-7-oxononanoate synthase [Pirellulaceae bacterium]|nr:8-amino-7-oxononanoate synthase [Pirellulaceae bacterium]
MRRYHGGMPDPLDWLDDALNDLDRRGLRRSLTARTGPQRGDKIEIGGQTLVNFGSNDYLGLAADPRVAAAAKRAIDEYGWGSGASPLVTGRSELHAELERQLAEFEGTEAALLFSSGYAANVGAICALVGKGDAIYSDELNHASIIDGCRLSGATIHVYHHCDVDHLRDLLASGGREPPEARHRLIVTDSLFSMHGDAAPLVELVKIAREHRAMLLVDEAHATGVLGQHGRGVCEELRIEEGISIRVGTLSKALGSHGGFVAGSQRLIDWLANRARPYVFSTAAPPAVVAAALAALEIVSNEPERRQKLDQLAVTLRRHLVLKDLIQPTSLSHIIPIILGHANRTMAAAAELRRRGFFVPGIRPPSVPEGQSLLRISLTCLHTQEQLDALVDALCEVAR